MSKLSDAAINHFIKQCGGNFDASEFKIGRQNLDRKIIEELVQFRNWIDYPIEITSAFRNTGSHTTGKAIDFYIWDEWKKSQPDALMMWRWLTAWPFLGIGIYFDWDRGIGFHADVIREERDRPLRWLRVDGEYYYQSFFDAAFYRGNMKTTIQFEIKEHAKKNN